MPDLRPEPRGPRVLIKPLDAESPSGIVLPGGVAGLPDRGIVIAVGPGYVRNDATYLALDLKPGDEVLYFVRNAIEVRLGDDRFLLLQDNHVLMRATFVEANTSHASG